MQSSKWNQQQEQNQANYLEQQLDNDVYREIDSRQHNYTNKKNKHKFHEQDNLIPKPRFKQQSKYMTAHTDQETRKKDNQNQNGIFNENQELKMKNQALKKQLQKFSRKLDAELSKRSQKAQVKNDMLTNMQLQNAYHRCQIYKKQLKLLKKRDLSFSEDKFNQVKGQLIEKTRQNQQLKNQVKQLKKIGKFQQKGLVELGNPNYIATMAENQKLKSENLRMKIKIQQSQRNNRLVLLSEKNQKHRKHQRQTESVKHAQQGQKKYKKQLSLLKSIHEKDSSKLRQLTFQKNRQQEIIENLTAKLQQKDKEIEGLKGTIINLRKIQKQRKQKRVYTQTNIEHNQSKLNTSNSKKSQFIIKRQLKRLSNKKQQKSQKQQQSEEQSIHEYISERDSARISQNGNREGIFLTENSEKQNVSQFQAQNHFKYPRLQQFGNRKQNTEQWNDHPFRSKIKQIQILPHEDGQIKDIHIRYQNGQPTKNQGKYSAFICEQFNQFITNISGGFKDQILQYLVVETNQKRKNKFCRYDIEGQCEKFSFNIRANQYPSALFGEKTNQGIVRIGCFIERQGQK